jgi:5-methylthioadenosine/S-adenosylhomocysteine deaminase
MAQPIDLLITARWIIPIEPHGTVFEGHAVAVDQGRIVALLPRQEAQTRFAARESVELAEHALIPGLINAHTHNPMTLMRGLADDLPLMRWLQEHIWPAEARVMGPEFVRDGVELAIAEMLRGGTTCCNENYFFPDVQAAAYARHGFRAVVGLPVIEFPSAWASTPQQYLDKGLEVRDAYRDHPLLGFTLGPHAPYTVSDDTFAKVRVLSDQLDLPVHLHLHETSHECEESRRQFGVRPLARIEALGLLTRNLIAVHMTDLTETEIARCAEAGVSVVHCPESNLKLASGFCPAARLLAAGVNLALGSDGCASNNDLDLFGEMRTAALLAKGVAGDAGVLDAATALRMATLNGARALGLDERVGSIVPGKEADLAAIRLDELETSPLYHVISHLVYAASRRQVTDVWIAGRRQLAGRELTGIDPTELRERAGRWGQRLAAVA